MFNEGIIFTLCLLCVQNPYIRWVGLLQNGMNAHIQKFYQSSRRTNTLLRLAGVGQQPKHGFSITSVVQTFASYSCLH